MCRATGCPLRQEIRTNYFSLSFDGNQSLQVEVNVIIKPQPLLFWQVVLYPTQTWGKVLILQQCDLHASQNRNIRLTSNLNDGTQQKLLFPLPTHVLSEARINCQYILYKNNSQKPHPGKTVSHPPFNMEANYCKCFLPLTLALCLFLRWYD